ncbi:hypothetical protein Patl1_01567 [Pistacia atlantica]|uniref:Uncharacterized protein n=1 Tax=Pistacia atlantica TaxID=434234 RepID=A0ACC1CC54_9ROSI|nr:hypothetical protein Patl1_01567 [Pistacia atlantica]
MLQRSHVPQFGNWESEENVPYTMYFDKARKGRTGGKMINPNDPQENPDILSSFEAPDPAPPKVMAEPEIQRGQGAVRTEQRRSREDSEHKQYRDSPARHDDMGRKSSSESNHQRQGGRVVSSGEAYKRPVRNSAGSENSFDRSPLHNQARNTGRGSGDPSSPAWEGKNLYKNSHGTPGRSRMKPATRGDESPDAGAAVPKFGDWDENNPASADGYTHIFNRVRQERNNGPRAPGMASPSPYNNVHRQSSSDSVKSCCFPWGKK